VSHTPGPWTLIPLEEDFPGIGKSLLKNQRLVGANRISPGIVFGGLGEETDANAHLIATAPELLGALKFLLAFYEPGQTHLDTEAWKVAEARARYAVAKAEGSL
jgi:hypothetical protein